MREMKPKNISSKVEDFEEKNDEGIVTIAVSSFNTIDSQREIILPGAYKKTIENIKRIKHLYNHNLTQLIGLPIELFETSNYLIARSKMNLKKNWVKDIFTDYKFFLEQNRTLEHSVMIEIIQSQYDKERDVDILKEVKLYEYSTLSFLGANEDTPLISLKSMLNLKYSEEKLTLIENKIKDIENKLNNQPDKENISSDSTEIKNIIKTINYEIILNHFKNGNY